MLTMKYIVVESPQYGFEEMILFPASREHAKFANALQVKPTNIISAGFVTNMLMCYGESISLGIKSRPEDTKLLQRQFGVE